MKSERICLSQTVFIVNVTTAGQQKEKFFTAFLKFKFYNPRYKIMKTKWLYSQLIKTYNYEYERGCL